MLRSVSQPCCFQDVKSTFRLFQSFTANDFTFAFASFFSASPCSTAIPTTPIFIIVSARTTSVTPTLSAKSEPENELALKSELPSQESSLSMWVTPPGAMIWSPPGAISLMPAAAVTL